MDTKTFVIQEIMGLQIHQAVTMARSAITITIFHWRFPVIFLKMMVTRFEHTVSLTEVL